MIDFPHSPPDGYSYSFEDFKRGVIRIWLHHHSSYSYTKEEVKTVWGFYKPKTKKYYIPVNHKTVGKEVDISDTRDYTAMPILLNPLMSAFV